MVNVQEFGSIRNLRAPVNQEVIYDNGALGMGTISFHLSFPGSGAVVFEGCYHDDQWIVAEMRNGAGSYVTVASATDNFAGSIAQFKKFRVRVTTELTAEASVVGRATEHAITVFTRT